MDKKGSIRLEMGGETKPDCNWNRRDVFFIVAPVICIILVPLGGLFYLTGRFNPYLLYLLTMTVLSPFIIAFVLLSFGYGAFRLFSIWRKDGQKIILRIVQTGILLVFIILFSAPFFIPKDSNLRWSGHKFLIYGLRDRVRSQANIREIRDWLKTLSKEDYSGEPVRIHCDSSPLTSQWPDSIEWPQSLKVFNPGYIELSVDENERPRVRLTWGGPFGHWGVVLGAEDMEIPPSDFSRHGEYRLPVEAGVYVWYEVR